MLKIRLLAVVLFVLALPVPILLLDWMDGFASPETYFEMLAFIGRAGLVILSIGFLLLMFLIALLGDDEL